MSRPGTSRRGSRAADEARRLRGIRRAEGERRDVPPPGIISAARAECRTSEPGSDGRPPRAAALAAASGAVYTGRDTDSPVEDGAVVPAERIALYKAVMAGDTSLRSLAICAGLKGTADGGPPDGTTLQILHEFSPVLRVYWGSAGRVRGGDEVRDLLPGAFTRDDLDRAATQAKRSGP